MRQAAFVLSLAAIDWPVLYSIKLGQVGPLLLLAIAVGWRWLDRPVVLGLSIAAGAIAWVVVVMLATDILG